ncbi:LysE family translocator [Stetteria hydrogenophila]
MTAADYSSLIRVTLALTPSGALSPGPLSASAMVIGAQLGVMGGLALALGHMLAEIPYVLLVMYSSIRMKSLLRRKGWVLGLFASAFIFFFAALTFKAAAAAWRGEEAVFSGGRSAGSLLGALGVGSAMTILNPHFLLWWLSVGMPMVEGAATHGLAGFAVMYTAHLWMDFAWLSLLALAANLLMGNMRLYAALMALIGAILVYYGVKMAASSLAWKR